MVKFETGKKYLLHGAAHKREVTVVKRSAHYITVSGDYSGRLLVRSGCFGELEFVLVPVVAGPNGYTMRVLCFATNTM